jgi:ParB-like chromosome segregation protein Spo0J
MSTPEFHTLASLFPLLEGADFDELVADIRENGLHEPIVVFEGRVLDGRNRLRACEAAGIEPTFTVYTGDDPVAYVISLNLRRRHLDESQRAMVAAKLATLKLGDNQHAQICAPSQERAAELLNVSRRTVQHAREVQEHGTPELVHVVESGEVERQQSNFERRHRLPQLRRRGDVAAPLVEGDADLELVRASCQGPKPGHRMPVACGWLRARVASCDGLSMKVSRRNP